MSKKARTFAPTISKLQADAARLDGLRDKRNSNYPDMGARYVAENFRAAIRVLRACDHVVISDYGPLSDRASIVDWGAHSLAKAILAARRISQKGEVK